MEWCIYVGKAATKNFEIGLLNNVWGHKSIFKGVNLKNVRKGDTLFFIHHLMKLKGSQGYESQGFPRVPVSDLFGVVASLTQCMVTSDYFESDELVWSDDIYPHRFNFKVVEQKFNVNFGTEFFSSSFVTSIRDSLLKKGSIIEFSPSQIGDIYNDIEFEYITTTEGRPVYRTHLLRERDKKIVELKKNLVLSKQGVLKCEVCTFDFESVYGKRGENYIECHHINPLSDTSSGQKTKLDDLALLCSNCHKIVHRYKPWISIDELRGIYNE
jgi:5-methylcytosine-specific restriction protein A